MEGTRDENWVMYVSDGSLNSIQLTQIHINYSDVS